MTVTPGTKGLSPNAAGFAKSLAGLVSKTVNPKNHYYAKKRR